MVPGPGVEDSGKYKIYEADAKWPLLRGVNKTKGIICKLHPITSLPFSLRRQNAVPGRFKFYQFIISTLVWTGKLSVTVSESPL